MRKPGGRDRANSKLVATVSSLAQAAACPLPCWRDHIANLIRTSTNHIAATKCELCGQVILAAEWRSEFERERVMRPSKWSISKDLQFQSITLLDSFRKESSSFYMAEDQLDTGSRDCERTPNGSSPTTLEEPIPYRPRIAVMCVLHGLRSPITAYEIPADTTGQKQAMRYTVACYPGAFVHRILGFWRAGVERLWVRGEDIAQ